MVATAGIELRGPVGLDAHGLAPSGVVHWNPTTRCSTAMHCCVARRGSPRAGRSSSIPASTPAVHRSTSSSCRSPAPKSASPGAASTSRSRRTGSRALRGKIVSFLDEQGRLRRGRVRRGRSGTSARVAGRDVQPVARALREDALHRSHGERAAAPRAGGARPACAGRRGLSGDGWHAVGDVRGARSFSLRGADRGHVTTRARSRSRSSP